MASNSDRFKRIADNLGGKITDLLEEEDAYVDSVLFALEDLKLSQEEKFLEATPEQLKLKNVPEDLVNGFVVVQERYKDIYLNPGERGVRPAPPNGVDYDYQPILRGSPRASPIPARKNAKNETDRKKIEKGLHFYDIPPANRVGLIIINKEFKHLNTRTVAADEKECLIKTAKLLEIKINEEKDIIYDKTAKEIREIINNFVETKIPKKRSTEESDALLFIALCSHGGKGDKISGVNDPFNEDSEPDFLLMSEIEKNLNTHKILIGRPKIFIIQTCRGGSDKVDTCQRDLGPSGPTRDSFATCTSDTVIVFTSGQDERTCVDKESLFLNELNECLKNNKTKHFLETLTICTGNVAKKCTNTVMTCTFQSSLQKFLKFDTTQKD